MELAVYGVRANDHVEHVDMAAPSGASEGVVVARRRGSSASYL